MEFELRASSLLGRCSTTWATPPAHSIASQRCCLGWGCDLVV
jgi:hypothetical protein